MWILPFLIHYKTKHGTRSVLGPTESNLWKFYFSDIENCILTRDKAKEYIQELFLMLQSYTHINSPHFMRGGQSHFCIGGYLEDGTDGFNKLSKLIVEALMELPTYIPQITDFCVV